MQIIVLFFSSLSVVLSLLLLILEVKKTKRTNKRIAKNCSRNVMDEPETVQLLKDTISSTEPIVYKDTLLVINSAPINGKKLKIKPHRLKGEKTIFNKYEVRFS